MAAGRSMKNVLVVSSGFLLLFSATGSLVSLQSSLNAEEGVGVASASTLFASVILSSMFLAPLVIRVLGCKWTIVAAMSCHVTYTAGNFCPGWATLIPTSVVLGLGEAPLWSATSTYLILTGQAQARQAKARSQDLINQYFGIWFLFYQSAAVWGSLMSSLVLGQDTASVNVTEEDLQFCGAGSCLDQEEFINSTRPAERLVHTLMGCYLGAGVLAMLLVAVFLDNISGEGRPEAGRGSSGGGLEVRRSSKEEVRRGSEEEVRRSSKEEVRRSSEKVRRASSSEEVRRSSEEEEVRRSSEEEVRRSSEEEVGRSSEEEEPFCSTFLATFRQLRDRRQVLLIPLTSYIGLELGFLSGEYNRDYVTCALGIRFVGYAVICFGSSSALCCFLFGRLSRYTGRVTLFSLAAVTHLSCILALLFWRPHPDQLPVFFVFPALWGLADAVWQTQTNALYGVLFHRRKEAAFANYRLWESAGYVVAFACSHFLCVSTKLYVLLSALLLSVALCFAVEYGEFRNPTPEHSAGATTTQEKSAAEELGDQVEEAGLK